MDLLMLLLRPKKMVSYFFLLSNFAMIPTFGYSESTQSLISAITSKPISNQRQTEVIGKVWDFQKGQPVFKTRGAKAVNIFSSLAPSVVLIITEDGIGSGSIINNKGQVLTNWHVIEGYDSVAIAFMPTSMSQELDETKITGADVIAIKKDKDLALLQITGSTADLPPAISLGEIEDIEIGADTHAIGHPTGQFWTYTRGYISQIRPNYEWSYDDGYQMTAAVIQTQTPISPGNSGGPLINENGQLIGVNSFKGDGEAINFAVALPEINAFLQDPEIIKPEVDLSECETKVLKKFRSKDDNAHVTLIDRNCNDIADASIYEPDDSTADIIIDFDENEDGKIDGSVFDREQDGYWDYSLWDSDLDGEFDMQGIHENGEIDPSSYKEMAS
jgi:S1-C subfamily serine protease